MRTMLPWLRGLLLGVLAVVLGACSPWLDGSREEDHPLLNEAIARKAFSPVEAARLLEKALEANPRLARAHWELALICLNNTSNYAAAVYHFQKLLALRPDWPHANTAHQLIAQAKLELVKEGVELPAPPTAQRQMDRYVAEIHRLHAALSNLQTQVRLLTVVTQQLTAQNLQLRQHLLAAAAVSRPTPQPPAATSSPASQPQPAPASLIPPGPEATGPTRAPSRATTSASPAPRQPAQASSTGAAAAPSARLNQSAGLPAGGRTHTFRPGETAQSVAKRYHLTLRDLRTANPGFNPNQVRAGQTIRLP